MSDRSTLPQGAFYDRNWPGEEADDRLFSAIALRNNPPMIAALAAYFADLRGPVLEIGAGTGQHAGAFSLAFPHLYWWPSDPVPEHRTSISAWAKYLRAPGLGPLDIDASSDWADHQTSAVLGL